jgi:predicted cupin superfamily sugar epimerase
MSCSVCPGFAIDDFKWASVGELLVEFPEQAEIIRRLQPDFVPEGNL